MKEKLHERVLRLYGIDLYQEGKVQCPKCAEEGRDSAGDNLRVYGVDPSTGKHRGAFCWGGRCSYTLLSEEEIEKRGEESQEQEFDIVGTAFNPQIHEQLKEITTTDSKNFRGIRKDITTFFGVRHEIDTATGEVAKQYYPCTTEGNLTGYKIRRVPKDFSQPPLGETGKDADLFGWFRFKNEGGGPNSRCLIVGGEVDQLSAFQMLKDYQDKQNAKNGTEYAPPPVVSSTIGESGAHKQAVKHYAWFDRFDKIIICMDSDEAGQEAAERLVKALPKGKCHIMQMELKDPNEYLVKGRQADFVNRYFRALPHTPNGIVGSGGLMDRMKQAVLVPKIPLPPFMKKLQKMTAGGFPLGRIINLGSASGTGKSTIVDECVFYWIYNSPHKIGIVSLESDVDEYGIKLLSRKLGRKIDLIEDPQEKYNLLCTPEVEAAQADLEFLPDGSHRFYLMDERDGGLDDLKAKIMELIVACDCKVIILDPLQDILDGMSNEEQAVFMRWQKGMNKSHKVTFININHVRKSGQGGKQNSQGADLSEEDFQGSSAIFKSGACNLLFTRNKEAECDIERNITKMKMTKCRWTGNTSPKAGEYYYDNETHTIHDLEEYLDRHPKVRAEYEAGQMAKEDQQ
ncbi:DNA primase/helicase [Pseudomonas phage vB_PpuM-Amme-3]|uniref:DNA primase/helicase n=2 Tax=Tartuvirus TaxID=3424912 RepID=A0AAX4MXM3_9CAUD